MTHYPPSTSSTPPNLSSGSSKLSSYLPIPLYHSPSNSSSDPSTSNPTTTTLGSSRLSSLLRSLSYLPFFFCSSRRRLLPSILFLSILITGSLILWGDDPRLPESIRIDNKVVGNTREKLKGYVPEGVGGWEDVWKNLKDSWSPNDSLTTTNTNGQQQCYIPEGGGGRNPEVVESKEEELRKKKPLTPLGIEADRIYNTGSIDYLEYVKDLETFLKDYFPTWDGEEEDFEGVPVKGGLLDLMREWLPLPDDLDEPRLRKRGKTREEEKEELPVCSGGGPFGTKRPKRPSKPLKTLNPSFLKSISSSSKPHTPIPRKIFQTSKALGESKKWAGDYMASWISVNGGEDVELVSGEKDEGGNERWIGVNWTFVDDEGAEGWVRKRFGEFSTTTRIINNEQEEEQEGKGEGKEKNINEQEKEEIGMTEEEMKSVSDTIRKVLSNNQQPQPDTNTNPDSDSHHEDHHDNNHHHSPSNSPSNSLPPLSLPLRYGIPLVYELLDNPKIQRSDFWRYLTLLSEGGVYSDVDTRCLKKVEDWGWIGDNLESESLDSRKKGTWKPPSVVVAIEADVGNRHDWHDWWPRPMQIAQWTMASAPGHPIMVDVVRHIVTETLSPLSQPLFSSGGDLSSIRKPTSVVEKTGPGVFTDAVLRYLEAKWGVTWADLRGLPPGGGKRWGDVVVRGITGFSPGIESMGAGNPWDRGALVQHAFWGSWKGEDDPKKKKREFSDSTNQSESESESQSVVEEKRELWRRRRGGGEKRRWWGDEELMVR